MTRTAGLEKDGSDDEAEDEPWPRQVREPTVRRASMRYRSLRPGFVTRRPGIDGRGVWHLPLAPLGWWARLPADTEAVVGATSARKVGPR